MPLRAARLAASSHEVTKGFAVKTSAKGHFNIYYAPGKDKAIVDLTADVLEAAYEALGQDLGHRPASPIRVELLGAPPALRSGMTAEVNFIAREVDGALFMPAPSPKLCALLQVGADAAVSNHDLWVSAISSATYAHDDDRRRRDLAEEAHVRVSEGDDTHG